MGSGHILVYLFDVLVQIYETYGYSTCDAARVHCRAQPLRPGHRRPCFPAGLFSVMMKARSYDRRFFSRGVAPKVYAIRESNNVYGESLAYFIHDDPTLQAAMDSILEDLHDAKEYGSILTVRPVDFNALYTRFDEIYDDFVSFDRQYCLEQLLPLVQVAEVLAQKYQVVVTNPPYMGSGSMSANLSDFVKKHYPDSKNDLFAVFIERGNFMTMKNGYNCMVTMQSWMFLSSFEKMRAKIFASRNITNLMHMDNMVLGIAFGTAVTVFQNSCINGYKGTYNHIRRKRKTLLRRDN